MKENNEDENNIQNKNNINNEKERLLKEKEMEKEREKENNNNNNKFKVQYDTTANEEYDKERIKHSKNLYEAQEEQQKKMFYSQRHLYERQKDKKDPLINIYSKNLQEEYINEVNYILRNSIITIIIAIIILVQAFLIIKNFKSYTENILSLIFGCFVFFNSLLVIIELYRNALRDQIRFKLHKLFSLFLSTFLLALFVCQILNSFTVYGKIKLKKEKCQMKKIGCSHMLIYNIILALSCLHLFGILLIIKFQMWLGFNSIRVLLGYQLEVIQKQILEDKNDKKDDINPNGINNEKKKNDGNVHQKQD